MKSLLTVLALAVIAAGAYLIWGGAVVPPENGDDTKTTTNFSECVAAGNPVQESYPRKCTENGRTFVEDIGNELAKRDIIRIDAPRPNAEITSPLEITGEARGPWFFEANFSVKLVGEDGSLITEGIATADGEWMTEDFVPFTAELVFETPTVRHGTLILEKQNASGLPENADALRVPVIFKNAPENDAVSVDMSDWQTYTSEAFHFSIKYPPGWIVREYPDDDIAPKFNVFPLGTVSENKLPLTHHSAATHVSIFPEGIPTEGVSGEQTESAVSFTERPENARDYVLADGTPFATFANNFVNRPASWNESGFAWANVARPDEQVECFSDGAKVSMEQCDPLMGDMLVRHGSVDASVRALEAAMLESLRFIE